MKVKPGSSFEGLSAVLPQVPRACGVYLFKDHNDKVLYVGKAVNLKNRLNSYGKTPQKPDAKTALMLRRVARVNFILTATEREALILERNLIKEHRPRFNVQLRDDKNFLCLRLEVREDFGGLRFVRRFYQDGALYFGPYASAAMARQTLKVMKQAFVVRTCKERRLMPRSRPCLEHQLGQCLAPCAGLVSLKDYQQAVTDAVNFLKGRGGPLLKKIKARMQQAAIDLDFERAALLRDRLAAIKATLEPQDMALPSFKDQDVLGLAQEDGRALVLVLMVRGGLVTGSRQYYFPEFLPGDDLLAAFVKQYYGEERPLPEEILLPRDLPERRLLAEVLGEQKGAAVRLVAAAKGDRGRLLALAADNARAALAHKKARPSPEEPLTDLQKLLSLPQTPRRLECFDISTLQGRQAVGAVAAFLDGAPHKEGYRRFRIRQVAGQDDYAMLREVVRRHYGKVGRTLPDLLVVDGGKGQLSVVTQTLKEMGLTKIPVVALAKAGVGADGRAVRDRLFLPGRKNPRLPRPSAPGWLLLLRLRDEAHRFAITYHRKRARKELLESALSQAPGIGPVRLKRLFQHYPNLEAIKEAPLEELAGIPGFTIRAAQNLKEWLVGEGAGL